MTGAVTGSSNDKNAGIRWRPGSIGVTRRTGGEREVNLPLLDQALPGQPGQVVVQGCAVRFRHVARAGSPRILLVHGGGAHSGWWLDVAPRLAANFDLLIPDLSGHGDSSHRASYEPEIWADELAGVASEAGREPVIAVAHSMGGRVSAYFAARWPRLVAAIVMIDTTLRGPGPHGWERPQTPTRPRTVHPDIEAALASFRLEPPQTKADPALLRRVALLGLAPSQQGFSWKHDPKALRRITDNGLHDVLSRVWCPVGYIHGELSPNASAGGVSYLEGALPRSGTVPFRVVANAYHHVPLDAPRGCQTAVEQVMEELMPR